MTGRWRCGGWDRGRRTNDTRKPGRYPGLISDLWRGQILDLDAVAVFNDLGDPPPMTVEMIAFVAQDADRSGLLDQLGQLVEFFLRLSRLQVLGVDLLEHVVLAAARGLPAILWGAEAAQMQI